MKNCLFLILASLFFVNGTFAALPPLAQSSREIEAILSDDRLQESLGSPESIQNILRIKGGYAIVTQNCFLRIDVEYMPQSYPGPMAFQLHFHSPVDFTQEKGQN